MKGRDSLWDTYIIMQVKTMISKILNDVANIKTRDVNTMLKRFGK